MRERRKVRDGVRCRKRQWLAVLAVELKSEGLQGCGSVLPNLTLVCTVRT